MSGATEHRYYIVASSTVVPWQGLVVQAAFGVGLALPCLEAGMVVDH